MTWWHTRLPDSLTSNVLSKRVIVIHPSGDDKVRLTYIDIIIH